MIHPRVLNASGGKIASHSDLRVGHTMGESIKILQWNAGGLSTSKKAELQKVMEEESIDVLAVFEANLTMDSVRNTTNLEIAIIIFFLNHDK